jgi:hypothetical protein
MIHKTARIFTPQHSANPTINTRWGRLAIWNIKRIKSYHGDYGRGKGGKRCRLLPLTCGRYPVPLGEGSNEFSFSVDSHR